MRKNLIVLLCVPLFFVPINVRSQNIDNASFDSLCICAIDRIWSWISSDTYYFVEDTAQPFAPNQLYTSDILDMTMVWYTAQINYEDTTSHASNSVKIFTRPSLVYPNGEKFRGYIANGYHFYTNGNGRIDFSKGGSPFPYHPYSLKGMYKFEDTLSLIDEYAKAIVLLKKYNSFSNSIDTVGYAETSMELVPSAVWSPFELIIDYYSSATPDSVVVIFESSSMGSDPTTLWIDDISFDFTTVIDGPHRPSNIVVWPNPTKNFLFVEADQKGNFSFRISDITGKLYESAILSEKIDLSGFLSGIYFISLLVDNEILKTCKIVKL